jgi:hypothetical protein
MSQNGCCSMSVRYAGNIDNGSATISQLLSLCDSTCYGVVDRIGSTIATQACHVAADCVGFRTIGAAPFNQCCGTRFGPHFCFSSAYGKQPGWTCN